ncbi:unnamed protein product [Symbiodinium sp. CCMP2592]|nr:unnamed protein product [Symbiodinium sp. CCMP2592]
MPCRLRTDSNVLSSILQGPFGRKSVILPSAPKAADTSGLPLSFLQVDEWVEEVQTEGAGEGFVLHRDLESRGTGFILKANAVSKQTADDKLPMSLHELRILLLVLKFLLALAVVVQGGATCARLIRRHVAVSPTPSKELKEAVSTPKLEEEEESVEQAIRMVSAEEVEQLLPSFRGSYDCALSKPKSVGQPLRFRARIYGPLDEQLPLSAPMCEEVCVVHKTKVEQNAPGQEAKVIAERSGCVDFVATLEGAPDIQLTVHGKEVRMCFSSCAKEMRSLRAVPAKWREFVQAEGAGADYAEEDPLVFQEEALRVGQLVTLVGDLHRDASGQLLLWPAPASRLDGAAASPLLDGVHVLVSDDPNFGAKSDDLVGAHRDQGV